MNTIRIHGFALGLYLAGMSMAATATPEWKSIERENAPALEYAVVTPTDFDPSRAYPVLLALPPGPQTRQMVERGLELYWAEEAEARGWIVISPAAPDGVLFFQGSETAIPELLAQVRRDVKVESTRFHLAGVSNGGRSAFRIIQLYPQEFLSLLTLPGFPSSETDKRGLEQLINIPVHLFVGEYDRSWLVTSSATFQALKNLGSSRVTLNVVKGEGHTPRTLQGKELFDLLDKAHKEAILFEGAKTEISVVLDDFHKAASEAELERYFGHFTPDAVFLGTDATERWSVSQFREYARPHFGKGTGWTYTATERHIALSDDFKTGWFDERLANAKYGEVRGTGVLRKINDGWRIAQYNLSFPVPNELAGDLVERIKTLGNQ